MTVLSYKYNRFNTATSKTTLANNRQHVACGRTLVFFNFTIMAMIIGVVGFYIISVAQATNLRLDIQNLEEKEQGFEEKNIELQAEVGQLQTSSKLDQLIAQDGMVKDSQPIYFAIKKSVDSVGLNIGKKGNNE